MAESLRTLSRGTPEQIAAYDKAHGQQRQHGELPELKPQIEKVSWRGTLAECTFKIYQHLDGTLGITYGPQRVGCYTSRGEPIAKLSSPSQAV